jgi:hypothetical protein
MDPEGFLQGRERHAQSSDVKRSRRAGLRLPTLSHTGLARKAARASGAGPSFGLKASALCALSLRRGPPGRCRQSRLPSMETAMTRFMRRRNVRSRKPSHADRPRLTRLRVPFTEDVRVWRNSSDDPQSPGAVKSNVPWSCIQHSPTGWECGYAGSGPADLALNILSAFVPPRQRTARLCLDAESDDDPHKASQGTTSRFAWKWHQAFKRDFIESMDRAGGTLDASTIRAWIDQRRQPSRLV